MHGETLVGYTASDEAYALIVDIGTTTVAALLVDTARRRVVAARGEHNAQSPYGADVISRIRHETEWEEDVYKRQLPHKAGLTECARN